MVHNYANIQVQQLSEAKRKLAIPDVGTTFTDAWTWTNLRVNSTGVGFNGNAAISKSAAYTFTNAVPLRTIDVSTATPTDTLNALAALVADLKSVGLLG